MPKTFAAARITVAAALFCAAWVGCSADRSGMPQLLEASALHLSGRSVTPSSPGLESRGFDAQVLLIAERTDDAPPPGCPAVTQHRASARVQPDTQGFFEFPISPRELTPISHLECPLESFEPYRIQALRLSANLEVDAETCRQVCAFAQTDAGADPSACETDCRGSGQIRAVDRAEGDRIPRSAPLAIADLTLNFSEVSPALNGPSMPDLRIDGRAAVESISIEIKSFEADSCAIREGCLDGPGARKLLTFDTVLVNSGGAPLLIGDPNGRTDAHFDACHAHHHLGNLTTYELISPDGETVAEGRKQGFCLMDGAQVSGVAPGGFSCEYQGISPGWADIYDRALDCQWIDVTTIAPGKYFLKLSVNTQFKYEESNYQNNSALVPVTIPGDPTP